MTEDTAEKIRLTLDHILPDHTKTDRMTEKENKPSKEESKTTSELADRLKILEAAAAEWLMDR
jgi:hypothetical protein